MENREDYWVSRRDMLRLTNLSRPVEIIDTAEDGAYDCSPRNGFYGKTRERSRISPEQEGAHERCSDIDLRIRPATLQHLVPSGLAEASSLQSHLFGPDRTTSKRLQ